jgi:quercetin dioxygenase-like cupin family protein
MPAKPDYPTLSYDDARVHETTLFTSEQWRPHFKAPGANAIGSVRGIAPGLEGQSFALGLIIMPPGQESPEHYYTGEHLFLQLQGATRFTVEGKEFVMRPMDSLFVPANVMYRYGSVGIEESRFVNVIGRTEEWPAVTHYPGFVSTP